MKTIHLLLILLMTGGLSYAQQNEIELNPYLLPEFTSGIVSKETGIKHNALLNYNMITEEMVFDDQGRKLAITDSEIALIDTVYIKDRKFIVLDGKFVEYLDHSDWQLYVEYKCRVTPPGKPAAYGGTSQTSAVDSYSSYITDGQIYQLKLPDDFELDPYVNYWLNKDGELTKFVNMRQLRKFYNDQKDLFKVYEKEHDVEFDDKESISQLIDYMESNQGA